MTTQTVPTIRAGQTWRDEHGNTFAITDVYLAKPYGWQWGEWRTVVAYTYTPVAPEYGTPYSHTTQGSDIAALLERRGYTLQEGTA